MIVGKKGWGVIPPPVGYSESVLLRDEQIDDHHQHCQYEEDRQNLNNGCQSCHSRVSSVDRVGHCGNILISTRSTLGGSVLSDHSVDNRDGHGRDHDDGNNNGNDIAREVFVLSHCQHLQF